MKCVLKSAAAFLLLLLACGSGFAQEKKNEKDADPKKTSAKSDSPSPAPTEQKIDIPLQQGIPAYGIKIPHYNDKGELAMELEMGTAQRLDESKVEMKDLKITILEENKKYFIEMPHALFNLDTRMLTSDTPTTIRRDDFEIVGDTAEFNTKTRFSRMEGKVKMTLFNIDMDQK